MAALFERTVSAICYEIARSQAENQDARALPPYNDVVAFVLGQVGRMPRFLARLIKIATLDLALTSLIRGHLFHRLSPWQRAIRLEQWRHSFWGPRRSLAHFYRALVFLALYHRLDSGRGGEHGGV